MGDSKSIAGEVEGDYGTVKVQLMLNGEGKLTQVILAPPFDKAAIGLCIKAQIKTAVFPHFRGDAMKIDYAFRVN